MVTLKATFNIVWNKLNNKLHIVSVPENWTGFQFTKLNLIFVCEFSFLLCLACRHEVSGVIAALDEG